MLVTPAEEWCVETEGSVGTSRSRPRSLLSPWRPGPVRVGERRRLGTGWVVVPFGIPQLSERAGPSADAVRLRQMAWAAETAKTPPPRALRYNAKCCSWFRTQPQP